MARKWTQSQMPQHQRLNDLLLSTRPQLVLCEGSPETPSRWDFVPSSFSPKDCHRWDKRTNQSHLESKVTLIFWIGPPFNKTSQVTQICWQVWETDKETHYVGRGRVSLHRALFCWRTFASLHITRCHWVSSSSFPEMPMASLLKMWTPLHTL